MKKFICVILSLVLGAIMGYLFSFFERLGATANEIFKGLRRGFDKMPQVAREAEEFTQKLLDGGLVLKNGAIAKKNEKTECNNRYTPFPYAK